MNATLGHAKTCDRAASEGELCTWCMRYHYEKTKGRNCECCGTAIQPAEEMEKQGQEEEKWGDRLGDEGGEGGTGGGG